MINFLTENFENMEMSQIATELKLKTRAVQHKANSLGLRKKPLNWTEQESQFLIANKDNLTVEQIAIKLNKTRSAVASKINHMGIGNKVSSYTYDKTYFKHIDTIEKAYWLGFIMADGCVSAREKDGKWLRLSIALQARDIEHLNKFIMNINGDMIPREYEVGLGDKSHKTCSITINSDEMARDLIKQNVCVNKTYDFKTHPKLPNDLFTHYLRGYFDGDGCLYFAENLKTRKRAKSVEITSYSEQSLVDFKTFLEGFGILSSVYINKGRNTYRLAICDLSNMTKFLRLMYDNSTPQSRLDRKYKKFKEFIELFDAV